MYTKYLYQGRGFVKIRTREFLLSEYNKKYPEIIQDPTDRLKQYFADRGMDFDKALVKAKKKFDRILKNREYKTIRITLYEYPMKTDRPRHTMSGHTYSPNAHANRDYFSKALRKVIGDVKLINTPAEIQIDAYLEMPNQVPPDEVILYEMGVLKVEDTPDYDNIAKCYTDMQLSNLVIDDDLYYKATLRKFYSVLPRVEIMVRYIATHESDYVFKKLKNRKSIKEALSNGLIVFEKMKEVE